MAKTFYKIQPKYKNFFNKDIVFRSTAYGKDVLNEFKAWLKFYNKKYSNPMHHLWASNQSDIGNNACFGKETKYDLQVKYIQSESMLNPLFVNGDFIQLTLQGFIKIGSRKTDKIVFEPKGWALSVIPSYCGEKLGIALLGKLGNQQKMHLNILSLDNEGITNIIRPIEIKSTNDRESYIVCLGQNIFAVHDSLLYYFYLNVDKQELEQVAIMEDKLPVEVNCCNKVLPRIVASQEGKVFWCANNAIYSFTLGEPRNVKLIDSIKNTTVTDLQYVNDKLFVYARNLQGKLTCTVYSKRGNDLIKQEFNSNATQNIFLSMEGDKCKYIGVEKNGMYLNDKGKLLDLESITKSNYGKAVYLYGKVECDIRSTGIMGDELIIVK